MKSYYTVIAILLLAIVTLALSHTPSQADDKKNNRFGIDNDCYKLYLEALTIRPSQPQKSQQLLDSMFILAGQRHDQKAQCVALTGKANGCKNVKELMPAVDTLRRFAINTPYKQYVFGAWGTLINTYIKNQAYSIAVKEIENYLSTAVNLDNAYGMARAHLYMSELYNSIDNHQIAIQEARQGLQIILQRGNKQEAYSFYQQLCKLYFNNNQIDSATVYADKVINDPMSTLHTYETAFYILGRIAARDDQGPEIYKQIQNIEHLYKNNQTEAYKSRYLIELHTAYASEILRDSALALSWANRSKDIIPKLQMLEEVYSFHDDFENAFKTKKQLEQYKDRYNTNHLTQQIILLDYLITSKELDYEQQQQQLYNSQLALQQSQQQQKLTATRLHLVQAENRKHEIKDRNRNIQQTNAMLLHKEKIARMKINIAASKKAQAEAEAETLRMQHTSTLVVSLFSVMTAILIAALIYIYRRNTYAAVVNKEMQHLRSETQLKDNLIRGIKDNIQNPLNRIITNIQILSKPNSDDDVNAATTQIHQATEDITSIIDQLSKIKN